MKLILLRHGESIWNKENRFTGWTDVELSEKGILEAKEAGKLLKEKNITFDIAYTSVLKRATDTLDYVLKQLDVKVPIIYDYHLNERHYGALQGLNKDATKKKYGEKQVLLWRRSVDVRPPALTKDDPRYPKNDIKYKDLKETEIPLTENLNDTIKRASSYFESKIKPELYTKNILIVAHQNSLRALIKYIENISDQDIVNFELPTGIPYVYEFDEKLNIKDKYFLK